MAQERVKVIVDVSGGVVQHVECGDFVEVTIVDWDNLEEGGRDAFAELTAEGQAYVLKHDPDFQLRYEDKETL